MNDKKIRSTHGAELNYVGKEDGITRLMAATRWDDNTLSFSIKTYWDGLDNEPMETSIRLGIEAYSALTALLLDFGSNMENFRIPELTK